MAKFMCMQLRLRSCLEGTFVQDGIHCLFARHSSSRQLLHHLYLHDLCNNFETLSNPAQVHVGAEQLNEELGFAVALQIKLVGDIHSIGVVNLTTVC